MATLQPSKFKTKDFSKELNHLLEGGLWRAYARRKVEDFLLGAFKEKYEQYQHGMSQDWITKDMKERWNSILSKMDEKYHPWFDSLMQVVIWDCADNSRPHYDIEIPAKHFPFFVLMKYFSKEGESRHSGISVEALLHWKDLMHPVGLFTPCVSFVKEIEPNTDWKDHSCEVPAGTPPSMILHSEHGPKE